MRTEGSQKSTRGLRLVGEDESGSASTNFGPLRVGLITTHRTNRDQVLSGSLRELERQIDDLHDKYCQAYVTLIDVMERLVRLGIIIKEKDTTD
jgi:hypothetical protein